jgi:hypothetical protein
MDRVEAMLKRKQEIDALPTGRFVETHQWLIEAVELLLELQKESPNEDRNQ